MRSASKAKLMDSGGGNIVWLASFPKSGNTWLRAMISALLHPEHKLDDLNSIGGGRELVERQFLDDICGIDTANLPYDRLLPYIRQMRLAVSAGAVSPWFSKTHDRFGYTADGEALFPAAATRLAILITRNPCDIAVSLAAHYSSSLDAAVERVCDPAYSLNLSAEKGSELLPVHIGDWSSFNKSWLDQAELPLLLLRYEDMVADPAAAIGSVAHAAGIVAEEAAIQGALAATAFDRLRSLEESIGFAEKPFGMKRFFRSGRAGQWRELLNAEQVDRIISCHHSMISRLGYELP
jgi:aryl sulfotransferase